MDHDGIVIVPLSGVDESKQVGGAPQDHAALYIADLERMAEGYWQQIGGTLQQGTWHTTDSVVFGIHVFNPRGGQRWLMFERAVDDETSLLGFVQMPELTLTTIANRRRLAGVGPRSSFINRGRWVYHINGYETPIRWDGSRTAPMGFARPAAAPIVGSGNEAEEAAVGTAFYDNVGFHFASTVGADTPQRGLGELAGSSATTARWRVGIAVTWVSDLGMESPLSEIVYVSGRNGQEPVPPGSARPNGRSGAMVYVGPAPDHVRAVRLWATYNLIDQADTNGLEDVYLVEEFTSAGGFNYILISPDEERRYKFDRDQVGPVPLGATAIEFWQGATWLLVDDVVHYSHPELFEQFPEGNRIPIGTKATGRGTGLKAFADGLLVFKESGVYIIKGNANVGYHAEPISEERGTPAPRAIVNVHGVGVFAIDKHGPYLVKGRLEADEPSSLVPLSGLGKTWSRYIGRSVLATAWAVHNPTTREVWFHCPLGGDPRPIFGCVFHYDIGQWSFRPSWEFACGVMYDGRLYLGSHNISTDAKSGVHVVTHGSSTKHGAAFSGIYETGHVRPARERTLLSRAVFRVYAGAGKITNLEYRADRRPAYTSQLETRTKLNEHAEAETDKWGEGVWGVAESFVDDEFQSLPISVRPVAAFEHSFRITGSLRLAGLELELHNAPQIPTRERR